MLTKREHELLVRTVRVASASFTLPFSWNPRRNPAAPVSARSSVYGSVLDYASLLLGTVHATFLVIRLIPGLGHSREDYTNLQFPVVMHALLTLAASMTVVVQIQALSTAPSLASILNQLLLFNRRAGREYTGHEYRPPDWVEKVVRFTPMYMGMVASFTPLVGILAPRNKYNYYSMVPEGPWSTLWVHLTLVAMEFYSMWKLMLIKWFTLYVGYVYVNTSMYWFKKMRLEWTLHSSRKLDVLHMYRSLTLLNTFYNKGFSKTLFPTGKTENEIACTFSLLGIIRLYRSTAPHVYVLFPLIWLMGMSQVLGPIIHMAHVPDYSTEFLFALHEMEARGRGGSEGDGGRRGAQMGGQEFKRQVTSCRRLYCRVGSLFFIEKSTKVEYVALFTNSFISLLLALAY